MSVELIVTLLKPLSDEFCAWCGEWLGPPSLMWDCDCSSSQNYRNVLAKCPPPSGKPFVGFFS
jgi:hypothetical protein